MSDASSENPEVRHISGEKLRSDARVPLSTLRSGARLSSRTALEPGDSLPETGQDSSKKKRSGWRVAVLSLLATVVIFFSAQLFGALIVSLYPALQHWPHAQASEWLTNSVPAQFLYGLLADALILGGVAGTMKLFGWTAADIALKRPQVRHIVYGFLAAVPYYLFYITAVLAVSALVPSFNVEQKQQIGFDSVNGLVPLVLTFVSLVVLPPLTEEITMRGFLYTGLRKWLPKIVAALVVSALFGAAHLAEGGDAGPLWVGAIDTFTLSLVLVFLREKTGNLWAGITLHAVKNGIAFVTIFLFHVR
jgi:membrane protease YdiL (CAAX protease family)